MTFQLTLVDVDAVVAAVDCDAPILFRINIIHSPSIA